MSLRCSCETDRHARIARVRDAAAEAAMKMIRVTPVSLRDGEMQSANAAAKVGLLPKEENQVRLRIAVKRCWRHLDFA